MKNIIHIYSVALMSTVCTPALAQMEQSREAQAGGLGDIVVTAQRREESLQSVPVAISAFTADTLTRTGVTSTEQLSSITPGLQIVQQRNGSTPYLRGIGTQNAGPGTESSIATYVDGIYYPYNAGNIFSLINVERIEVLKGPQGTLFGRNATGGLIHVITRKPQYQPMAQMSIGYGNYDTVTTSFYGTAGLSSTVAADISVFYTDQGKGWGRNLVTGDDINKRHEYGVRSKILFEPADDWDATLSLDYSRNRTDIGVYRNAVPGSRLADGIGLVGSIYDTRSNTAPNASGNQGGGSLVVNHDMGGVRLTSTTAYRKYATFNIFDQDSTPLRSVEAIIRERVKSFQQELLLNGTSGRLDYTGGLFYFFTSSRILPQGIRSATASLNTDVFSRQQARSWAAFGQSTYHLTDSTGLTIGLRYTSEKRRLDGYRVAVAPNLLAGSITQNTDLLPSSQTRRKFDKLTWRFALDQQFTPDILGYASVSRGFKSGSFATSNLLQPAVRPETLDAYAVGIKSDLFDKTLRFNIEAFYYDYKDIQLTLNPPGTTLILNASSGKVKGLDLDLLWAPKLDNGRLQIGGSVSYLDTHYGDFPNAPAYIPFPGTPIPVGFTNCGAAPAVGGNRQCAVNAKGNAMIRAPKWTTNVSIDYAIPVSAGLELGMGANWYHNSGFFWEPENRVRQGAYSLVNGQVYLGGEDDAWKVRLFVRNLTKEKYYTQISSSTFGDQEGPGAPRTYGIALDLKFQ